MTETLRSSKLPGKVSSWAWDWKVRGKGACGEKGHMNMATKCAWAYRAKCWYSTKTPEDPAANPCKYLFRVVLGHLTAIWTRRSATTQSVLRLTWASHFPGLSVLLRIVVSLLPGSCAKQLFLQSAPVQSFWLLRRFRKPTEPTRPPGQNGPDTQRTAGWGGLTASRVAQKCALHYARLCGSAAAGVCSGTQLRTLKRQQHRSEGGRAPAGKWTHLCDPPGGRPVAAAFTAPCEKWL